MIRTVHCPVSHANVTLLLDIDGCPSQVICPSYHPTGACGLKERDYDNGPLSQLIDRTAEQRLSERGDQCRFTKAQQR